MTTSTITKTQAKAETKAIEEKLVAQHVTTFRDAQEAALSAIGNMEHWAGVRDVERVHMVRSIISLGMVPLMRPRSVKAPAGMDEATASAFVESMKLRAGKNNLSKTLGLSIGALTPLWLAYNELLDGGMVEPVKGEVTKLELETVRTAYGLVNETAKASKAKAPKPDTTVNTISPDTDVLDGTTTATAPKADTESTDQSAIDGLAAILAAVKLGTLDSTTLETLAAGLQKAADMVEDQLAELAAG